MKKKLALLCAAVIAMTALPVTSISADDRPQNVTIATANQSIKLNTEYYLKNVYSGKYMQAYTNEKHSPLVQNVFNGTDNQKFKIILSANGSYAIVPTVNNALRFDVSGASSKNGSKIQLFTENPSFSFAQTFNLISNNDGTYRIVSKIADNAEKVLEIGGPSKKAGAALQIWDYVGAKNQQWILEPASAKKPEPMPEPEKDPETQEPDPNATASDIAKDVVLKSQKTKYSIDDLEIEFVIQNNSAYEIKTTDLFKLQIYENNEWKAYFPRKHLPTSGMAFGPKPNSQMDILCDVSDFTEEPLKEGKYRIIKDFSVEKPDVRFNKIFEFTVSESVPSKDGKVTLRKTYFNDTVDFFQLTYKFVDRKTSSIYTVYEGSSNEIDKIVSNILSVKGHIVADKDWLSRFEGDNVSTLEYYFENSGYTVSITLYGVVGGMGYVTISKDGTVTQKMSLKKDDYNKLRADFQAKFGDLIKK